MACSDGSKVGLASGRYSGSSRPCLYRTPHALHSVLRPIGPSRHCGVDDDPQCRHRFADFRGRHGFFLGVFGAFFFFVFFFLTRNTAGADGDAASDLPCFGGFFLSRYMSGTDPSFQIKPSGDESDTRLSGGGLARCEGGTGPPFFRGLPL